MFLQKTLLLMETMDQPPPGTVQAAGSDEQMLQTEAATTTEVSKCHGSHYLTIDTVTHDTRGPTVLH